MCPSEPTQKKPAKKPTKKMAIEKKGYQPPRGVNLTWRADRGKWRVGWRENGRQLFELFVTKNDAEVKCRELTESLKLEGKYGVKGMAPEDVRDIRLVRDALAGASVSQLLAVWERHKREVLGGDVKLLVSDAVDQFLALRKAEGLEAASLGPVKIRLARLSASIGDRLMVGVTTDDLRAWLANLYTERKKKKTAKSQEPPKRVKAVGWTLLNHYKSAHAFFERAVLERWIAENPMSRVKTPTKPKDDITVMSVEDGIKLLESNKDDPVSMRLALEMFGALRYSSTGRLLAEHLKTQQKGIHLPAKDHKSERRHFLQKLPDNLWVWVDRWKDDERAWETLSKRMLQYHKSKAFERAGVPHPHNVLRHSFCSYHIAKHGDAAKTAVLLQHTNQKMLYDHYCGYATEGDAERWFNIVP